MVSSCKPYFYHELETCVTSVTMVTLPYSSTSLLPFQYGKLGRFPYMCIRSNAYILGYFTYLVDILIIDINNFENFMVFTLKH